MLRLQSYFTGSPSSLALSWAIKKVTAGELGVTDVQRPLRRRGSYVASGGGRRARERGERNRDA